MMTRRRQPRKSKNPGNSRVYQAYGLRITSAWPLPYPTTDAPALADVSLKEGSAQRFATALRHVVLPSSTAPWVSAPLAGGWRYLRWSGIFEFLIPPDGRSIICHALMDRAADAFHTHLGPSLSFALLNLGIEPLHSTTIMVEGGAVALMGDCGYGKSSLGATFVKAGHALLTDDLLVLQPGPGGCVAYPGVPRVKLYPAIARTIFGSRVRGLRLKTLTPKLIIPLDGARAQASAVPLKAIYVMTPPNPKATANRITITRLSPRRACLELIRNTFNMAVTEPARLERQFALASALSLSVPIKTLSYPRRIDLLDAARRAILHDLSKTSAGSAAAKRNTSADASSARTR